MEVLQFLVALFLFSVPFFLLGWWLIRTSRSIDRLAVVVNDHNIDLGQIRMGQNTYAWLLLADVRFVLLLVFKRYHLLNLPAVVVQALDNARKDYLTMVGAFATIAILVFVVVLYENISGS
jgi:hypothetical protein